MSLSDAERELIGAAATTADPTRRRQAVAAVLSKSGADITEARSLLGQSFLAVTRPSFHLVPRGQAMESQADFAAAYDALAAATDNFSDVSQATLTTALLATPSALPALRMIACLTNKELAVATKLLDPTLRISDDTLKRFERGQPPDPSVTGRRADRAEARRAELASAIVAAIRATMDRQILTVPDNASATFHSKLDHQDTIRGWTSVHDTAVNGVPYSALLYHRYVGGVWRQVQDAYSEAKGDGILELPLAQLLGEEGIPYYRSPLAAPERPPQPAVLVFIPALISSSPVTSQQSSSSQRSQRTAGLPGTRPAASKTWLTAPAERGSSSALSSTARAGASEPVPSLTS